MERYAPDYDTAIGALIDAANHAGGKDNITVVVVASPGLQAGPVEITDREGRWQRLSAAPRWIWPAAALAMRLRAGPGGSVCAPPVRRDRRARAR